MCNEEMIGIQQLPRVGGIVFEGGMEVAKDSYINFTDILGEFCKKEISAHVYPAGGSMEIINAYGSAGSVIMQCMSYGTLIRQLSRYDWGFVGSPRPGNPQWDIAMPNKLFEFMAAGIPVIVHHALEVAEFVIKHEVGIVVESVDEIKELYHMHELYRKTVQAKRGLFTMESQSRKIMEIYDKALDVEKEKRLSRATETIADQERGTDCD
jgi:ribosomal protein S15P/S13E